MMMKKILTGMKMIIDCIADLHGEFPKTQGGDVLIVAGDCTASDKIIQWGSFFSWFIDQKYRKRILIGGNHDEFLSSAYPSNGEERKDLKEVQEFLKSIDEIEEETVDFEYLCDSGCEFEGIKFWGSPWTPKYGDWSFMKTEAELANTWELIPEDTNVLITHGPPFGILDYVTRFDKYCGDKFLRARLLNRRSLPELKLHVFGHIHEQGGKVFDSTMMKFVNCSYMNEDYKPVNRVMRVIL